MLKQHLRYFFAATAFLLAMTGTASAVEYKTIEPSASKLSFTYSQMNVNMDGHFKQLNASQFSFDPAVPEQARVVIEIPIADIDAGYGEANEELKKTEWLDTSAYPVAKFESVKVQALGDNRYQVDGKMDIKGNAREVSIPFTFTEKDGKGIFDGEFTFKRADFKVGEGMWGDFGIVANDIRIKFNVVAGQ
ncbi:YceI family protein [Advenella sp. RU8]|uniref:YceI family protein n=1 Tax=Advenella sp. RU8 TaxID=3399575 RepID=UPI003AAB53A6